MGPPPSRPDHEANGAGRRSEVGYRVTELHSYTRCRQARSPCPRQTAAQAPAARSPGPRRIFVPRTGQNLTPPEMASQEGSRQETGSFSPDVAQTCRAPKIARSGLGIASRYVLRLRRIARQ